MTQFCTECGKPLAEGAGFCTECGAKIVVTQEPVQEVEKEVQVAEPIQQPVMQMEEVTTQQEQYAPPVAPVPQQSVQPVAPRTEDVPPKGKYAVAGTGAYFGFMFLFGIPVIGWLVCFICAFAMKNKNLKNYAKSRVIWFFIKAVFWVGIFFLLRWIGNMIMDFVGGFFESEFGGLLDIFDQFKGLTDGLGELTDGLGELENISDGLGDLGNLSESLGDLEGLTEGLEGLDNLPIE